MDRVVFAGLYRMAPEVLDAVKIVKLETITRCIAPGSDLVALEIKAARRSAQNT
jgi:hypothetical protein